LNLRLPWERVDYFVKVEGGLQTGKNLAVGVGQLQVGYERHWVGHCYDALLHFDPVPRYSGSLLGRRVPPDCLSGAGVLAITHSENACAKMYKVQIRRTLGLPQ
jgi:hypothetical protein